MVCFIYLAILLGVFTLFNYMIMKRSIAGVMIAVFLLYVPLSSYSWGVLGHRIVGQIAETHLTKKTKKAVAGILGNESLAMSSNWGDFIKSDSTYDYLDTWHYVNLVSGLTKQSVEDYLERDTMINIYTKSNWLIAELKKRELPKATQQLYLRLLVHFIGDMHQPMHTGRPGDRGGNSIRVLWFRDSKNLHQVWDEALINFQQLSYTEYANAINFVTPSQRKQIQQSRMSDWIYESYQYAELIYADIKVPEQKLSYEYNFKYKAIVDEQLLKGGIRLAGILNEIYN
jgi:hypothetical protein